MDIAGLGDQIVDQLVDKGIVQSAADLYDLRGAALADLQRMGELSAHNLVSAIQESKRTTLGRFMIALGIPDVGEATARELADAFGSLVRVMNALPEVLMYVPGIGQSAAHEIHAFFINDHNRKVLAQLQAHGVHWEERATVSATLARAPSMASLLERLCIPHVAKVTADKLARRYPTIDALLAASADDLAAAFKGAQLRRGAESVARFFSIAANRERTAAIDKQLVEYGMHWANPEHPSSTNPPMPLAGKTFVLTGEFRNYKREDLRERIRALGGKVTNSVSQKTDYVIVGEGSGQKLQDALNLQKEIVNEDQIEALLGGGFQANQGMLFS
jgi:DNA ligase (NAD+)